MHKKVLLIFLLSELKKTEYLSSEKEFNNNNKRLLFIIKVCLITKLARALRRKTILLMILIWHNVAD